jgi:virulence-associated protein VagC
VNVAAFAIGADAVRLPEDFDLSHTAPLIQS